MYSPLRRTQCILQDPKIPTALLRGSCYCSGEMNPKKSYPTWSLLRNSSLSLLDYNHGKHNVFIIALLYGDYSNTICRGLPSSLLPGIGPTDLNLAVFWLAVRTGCFPRGAFCECPHYNKSPTGSGSALGPLTFGNSHVLAWLSSSRLFGLELFGF